MTPIRCTLLFVPASSDARIPKAPLLDTDAIDLDPEDGVTAATNDDLRCSLSHRLSSQDFVRRSEGIAIFDGELAAIDLPPQIERVMRRDARGRETMNGGHP